MRAAALAILLPFALAAPGPGGNVQTAYGDFTGVPGAGIQTYPALNGLNFAETNADVISDTWDAVTRHTYTTTVTAPYLKSMFEHYVIHEVNDVLRHILINASSWDPSTHTFTNEFTFWWDFNSGRWILYLGIPTDSSVRMPVWFTWNLTSAATPYQVNPGAWVQMDWMAEIVSGAWWWQPNTTATTAGDAQGHYHEGDFDSDQYFTFDQSQLLDDTFVTSNWFQSKFFGSNNAYLQVTGKGPGAKAGKGNNLNGGPGGPKGAPAIAGSVIGVTVGIGAGLFYLKKRRNNASRKTEHTTVYEQPAPKQTANVSV